MKKNNKHSLKWILIINYEKKNVSHTFTKLQKKKKKFTNIYKNTKEQISFVNEIDFT